MYNGITNFTYNSTLKSKNLLRSKTRIKIYNSTELGTKNKKRECMSQRLNDLARPNVRRIRSIFEKQKQKSKFDIIKAEKLLKLMNEPPKKPFDVKRCVEELAAQSKNKQECVTHSRDKAYEKCRQNRDFKNLATKNAPLENLKLQYNSSFKPQKNLIDNYNKLITNYNVTNFKVSKEKYITTEEFERRCRNNNLKPSTFSKYNRTNDNFVSTKPLSANDNKVYQKFKDLRNVPKTLFINRSNNDSHRATDYTGNMTFKHIETPRNSTADTENEAAKYHEDSIKMASKKALSFEREISSNDKPQADLISRQHTFDSGFEERMDTQNLSSYPANQMTPTAVTSPKNISKDTVFDNHINSHSFIEDPILGQEMEIPDFLTDDFPHNSVEHEDQQSIEFNSNINIPNSSSTPVDLFSIADISPISTMNSQLKEQSNDLKSHNDSFQVQKYSYPDIYENFSISLLTENDSSILKLSNDSSLVPQKFLARQSSFNKSANISDFRMFKANQEESSSRTLPVIALRDFSGYHDIGIDKDNEILVRVTSANFDKIYVVKKINDKRNLKEFCKNPVSSRSRLFLLNSFKEKKEIEIQKLGIKSYCNDDCEGSANDYAKNSLLSSINHEKFSVQKLDRTSRKPRNAGIDILVTENSDKNSNFTVIKEQQSHVTSTRKKMQN